MKQPWSSHEAAIDVKQRQMQTLTLAWDAMILRRFHLTPVKVKARLGGQKTRTPSNCHKTEEGLVLRQQATQHGFSSSQPTMDDENNSNKKKRNLPPAKRAAYEERQQKLLAEREEVSKEPPSEQKTKKLKGIRNALETCSRNLSDEGTRLAARNKQQNKRRQEEEKNNNTSNKKMKTK